MEETTIILVLGIILGVVVVLVCICIIMQTHSLARKRAVLSKEMSENVASRERYLQLKVQPEIPSQEKDAKWIPKLGAMSDEELFNFLRIVIGGERLFANPQFSMLYLAERFQLSPERIEAAFAASSYGSLAGYITDCRLSAGVCLLEHHPEMPIYKIAAVCGYSNAVTFNTQFKKRYTISPMEFREATASQ